MLTEINSVTGDRCINDMNYGLLLAFNEENTNILVSSVQFSHVTTEHKDFTVISAVFTLFCSSFNFCTTWKTVIRLQTCLSCVIHHSYQ